MLGVDLKKVLVTGGAGYIGSVLVGKLLKRGYRVRVLDNFTYGEHSLFGYCHYENLEVLRGDASCEKDLSASLDDVEFIYPLACLTGAPLCDRRPELAKKVNFDAIKLLTKIRNKNQKIIFPNTNSGYGKAGDIGMVDETSPLNPVSLYGVLKNKAEQHLLESGEAIAFRLATVFGVSPRMRVDLMVNDFVHKAFFQKKIELFESHFRRNFLYIGDVADGFIFAMENFEELKNNAYNLGLSSANITKKSLCELIKNEVVDFEIIENNYTTDPDQRDYLVNNAKIEEAGFAASTSLESGIKELLRLYRFLGDKKYGNV